MLIINVHFSFSQKRSLLANVVSGVSFLSLQHVTDKAKDIIAKHEKASEENPPKSAALKKQYGIQMVRLKIHDMPLFEINVNPVLTGWIMLHLACVRLEQPLLSWHGAHYLKGPHHISCSRCNLFDHQIDLDIIVKAFKFGRDLANHEPFKKVVSREANPGLNVETEADIIKHIKDNLCTVWQTSGTLPMLPKEYGGVVDPKLRVYGTSNIRVVDISTIPSNHRIWYC
ncbi:GMC oxidoreductase [Sphaerobolus stellatus SS14]|uniref:GMC oxidoreductase n=1 Tax=Sphaerobolus stellatus (strain SS14) TaxID=990650 RepID=A0A0C9V010_SPHS4|nr:GMC oxidoreductase [Sphaerobolus stellatus SS14]